jgi:hypothetical protein
MHQGKQYCSWNTAYPDACKTRYTIPVLKNSLPEDEPSGSKHVEDIKIRN